MLPSCLLLMLKAEEWAEEEHAQHSGASHFQLTSSLPRQRWWLVREWCRSATAAPHSLASAHTGTATILQALLVVVVVEWAKEWA